jgi:diguanylate cyclase (GGDEF)-like protein
MGMESTAAAPERRSADRRRREMAQGGWWGLGTMGVALPYALLTGGPHPGWLAGAAAVGVAISIAMGLGATYLPLGGRVRRPVMLLYSAAHVALTVILAIADGGADSPMALGFFGTFTFAACSMPPRVLIPFGALNVAGYGLVFAVAGAHRPEFVPVELAGLLATAAACAAQHGSLVRQRRKLAELARTDPLTGCLNRRGFGEHLSAALADASRAATGLAVLIVDLDAFKRVNDVHGHAAGDALLVRTAQRLRAATEPGGVVGRLGGDEFAVVLPVADAAAARAARDALSARLDADVPASVGVAILGPDGDRAEALLLAADRRLYARKARARSEAIPEAA